MEGTQPEVPVVEGHDRIARPGSHKIAVGGTAGAFTIILVWLLAEFAGIHVPDHVGQAFTMLAMIGVSLAVPDDMEAP